MRARWETQDSPAVAALKAEREAMKRLDGWGSKSAAKRMTARIRAQRLAEARERGSHAEQEWDELLALFNYRCVKCGCVPEGRPCKDHIVPIHQGGSDGINNLQPLCRECNTGKSDSFNWAMYRNEVGFEEEEGG